MKAFSELCACVKDQCDPATSGASVYVGLEHIDGGAFFLNRHGQPSEVQSAKTRFRKGDVLYGKLRPYLDKAVIAPCDGICSTDILAFRTNEHTCASYLLGLIHTTDFKTHADQTTNGVNHPRTSWNGLAGFSWNVPPKPVQEKIATVLWKVQSAIAVEAKLVATAHELKQSAMRQLFTRGLRGEGQKETENGTFPKSWKFSRVGDIASRVTKGASPRWQGFEYCKEGILFVRSQNIGWGRLELNERVFLPPSFNLKERKSILLPGDVLINLVGASIGRVALADESVVGANTNQAVCMVSLPPQPLSAAFLVCYLLSAQGQEMIQFSVKAVARENVSLDDVRNFSVPVPPLTEQNEIVNILQTIDRKILVHERKRAALSDLFQTMLHELMTAQIRVDQLDIDTREVKTT